MATRHQILADLDAELERESKRVGAELVWSASERALLTLIEANRDRAVQTALDYAEAQDDYVSLRSGTATFLKQQTMADLERSLDPQRFVRIHRRYLLNVERLARLEVEGETRTAVLKDGTRLPISRAGHQRLKALL